jgi:hypothetical protein
VHTYSLVHDDLPCMDNDDLGAEGRPRTRPSTRRRRCWRATPFSRSRSPSRRGLTPADPALAHGLVAELGGCRRQPRLIGGQMEDLLAEKSADATAESWSSST